MKKLFCLLYKRLIKAYPPYEGCGPCKDRPLPLDRRRVSAHSFSFPVDLVYTWVDGADQALADKRAGYLPAEEERNELAQGVALYSDNDELRYSLRSVDRYAPWVRNIFIITDGQTPGWLAEDHPKIRLVDHRDFIPEDYLPTFNSHVIEAYLHRIPGLAEHYVYFNDDFFLAAPSDPADFFTPNGLPYLFMDWRYSRRFGYAKATTPHACSWANTREYMQARGKGPAQDVIVAHVPYAQTKSNAAQAFEFFEEPIRRLSGHKFRCFDEMAFYCHCLPCWTFQHKKAVPLDLPFYYINTGRFDRHIFYNAMLREKNSLVMPLFFCLNDVGECGPGNSKHEDMRSFLRAFYSEASSFERPVRAD